jgi:hypothetical protein
MRNALLILLAVTVSLTAILMRSTGASQGQAQSAGATATVLLMLGHQAISVERWDGAVTITGGILVRTESRHFSWGKDTSGSFRRMDNSPGAPRSG